MQENIPAAAPSAHDALRAALGRVLKSSVLHGSERRRRLLTYLVEETLAGRGERLKAYNIGTAVLGRPETFDPQIDPAARIAVSRLRKDLAHFYLTDGRADEVRIAIPRGSYVPRLEPRPPDPTPAGPVRRRSRLPRVAALGAGALLLLLAMLMIVAAIAPSMLSGAGDDLHPTPGLVVEMFVNATGDPKLDRAASVLTSHVALAMTPFKSLEVYMPTTLAAQIPADYRLQGFITPANGDVRISAQLVDAKTHDLLWAKSYLSPPADLTGGRSDIPRQIARALGDPYGTIFSHEAQRSTGMAELRGCLLTFHQYTQIESFELNRRLQDCHEAAARLLPNNPTIWADLAFLAVDEYRFSPAPAAASLDRALVDAGRAVDLDPTDARAHLALAVADWFKRDMAGFFVEADKATALNPDDPLVLCEIGMRRMMHGDVENGTALVRRALAEGGQPVKYHDVLALYAYLHGDYTAALEESAKADIGKLPLVDAIRAAIYGKLGRRDDAVAAWRGFEEGHPKFATGFRAELLNREWAPEIADALISGITAAGIPVDPPARMNTATRGATAR
jgi:TolB-like protein